MRLAERPRFAPFTQAVQLREEKAAMPAVRREAGVTHLVNQDPPFRAWEETALNENPVTRRLVHPVATEQTCQVWRAPHRTGGDAAVEKLAIEIVKEPFEDRPSPVSSHSREITLADEVSNRLLSRPTYYWPFAARPSISSYAG